MELTYLEFVTIYPKCYNIITFIKFLKNLPKHKKLYFAFVFFSHLTRLLYLLDLFRKFCLIHLFIDDKYKPSIFLFNHNI